MSSFAPFNYRVVGNKKGKTVIFLHGWPDSSALWTSLANEMQEKWRIVLVNNPNSGADKAELPYGCTFATLNERLHATVEEAKKASEDAVAFVVHDWGCCLAYDYERTHPERVARIVAMDVGGHYRIVDFGWRGVLIIVLYQWWLAASWLVSVLVPCVGKPLGDWMTRRYAKLARAPGAARDITASQSFYYAYAWLGWLTQDGPFKTPRRAFPLCPLLYMYGTKKPFQLHSAAWMRHIHATPGSAAVRVRHSMHWVMRDQEAAVNHLTREWLERAGDMDVPDEIGEKKKK